MVWIVMMAFAMALAGVVLLSRGMRGVRMDDHPVCRRCGFDLFGLGPTSEKCPECGADLHLPRARIIGHRRRRAGLLTAGVGLLAVSLSALSFLGVARVRQMDLNTLKPFWWLKLEVRDPASLPVVAELNQRLAAGKLDDAQIASIADIALRTQGDPRATWLTPMGDFLEAARALRKLDDARWRKYAEQGVSTPTLRARPVVRRGDVVPYIIDWPSPRTGTTMRLQMNVKVEAGDNLFDPKSVSQAGVILAFGGSTTEWFASPNPKKLAATADGAQTLNLHLTCDVEDRGARGSTIGRRVMDVSAPWTLVKTERETVGLIHDAPSKTRMLAAITVEFHTQPAFHVLYIGNQPMPWPVAADVLEKVGDKMVTLGEVKLSSTPRKAFTFTNDLAIRDAKATHVDIILRPSLHAAHGSADMTQIWGDDLVFKDVPVETK
jgi:hypothetical protein